MDAFPCLVAEGDGEIIGFAYAGRLSEREAYDWCCESTVYVHPEYRRSGAGGALYKELLRILKEMGFVSVCAVIAFSDDTEHLDSASIGFHEAMGFREVGRYEGCGYKFGRWHGIVWMTKDLNPRSGTTDAPDISKRRMINPIR